MSGIWIGGGMLSLGILLAGSQLLLSKVFDQDLADWRSYGGLAFPLGLLSAGLGVVLLAAASLRLLIG